MNKRYKATVIGAGRFGMILESDKKRLKPATHFGLWFTHPRFDLVAVCDVDPQKEKIARKMKPDIRFYTDPEELIRKERPDVVSIATWKDSHYEMMKLVLKYKVPAIVLEKPIAEKIEHAREIVEEANRQGMHLLINHRRRFDSLVYEMRSKMRTGLIGEIMHASSYYVYGLVTTGTHMIDTLRLFLGEVDWVVGFSLIKTHLAPEDDPCVNAMIGMKSGAQVNIIASDMKDYDIHEIHFYGRKGKLLFKNIGRDFDFYGIIPSPEHDPPFTELEGESSKHWGGTPRNQFMFLGDNVLNCLESGAKSLSTGEDSLRALEILLAIQESAENKSEKIFM